MKLKEQIKYQLNPENKDSISYKHRRKRMKLFEDFFESCFSDRIAKNERIKVIDIGGSYAFWKDLDFKYFDICDFMLVNLENISIPENITNMQFQIGDATNLYGINDDEFDVAFSNSVIEHVGQKQEWEKMVGEMRRVCGRVLYLQTPNRYFPIEPHFAFPFFQFLPLIIQAMLINKFQIGVMPRGKSIKDSQNIANSVHLLSYKNLKELFPNADIRNEKALLLTKSFMVFEVNKCTTA